MNAVNNFYMAIKACVRLTEKMIEWCDIEMCVRQGCQVTVVV